MNPAALKANLRDLPRGATIIVNTDEFTKRNLAKVGYAASPLDDGSAGLATTCTRSALTSITVEALAGVRPDPQGQGAREEHVRARACCRGSTTGRPTGTEAFLQDEVRRQARDPRGQPRRAARRLELRRDDRGLRGLLRDRPGADAGRHLPQHHRQHRAGATAWSPPRTAPACPLVLGSYPITPASDILHTLSALKRLRRHDDPGRGRDRRHRRGARRGVRRGASA